jgi:Tfp pilus assembly protein PilX
MVFLQRLRSDERGIALIMALGFLIVLSIVVASVTSFTTSDTRSTSASVGRLAATRGAESGLNNAYAILTGQIVSSANPTLAYLFGCAGANGATDPNGPSNCASPTPQIFCPTAATCTAGSPGSVSLYGYFSGTNAQTFAGILVPASTWLLVSTGYDNDPAAGRVTAHTTYAEVNLTLTPGSVAAVWDHLFITSPLVAGQCSLDFSGNNISVNVPLYVIGNMCLGGSSIAETTKPVDVQVGGYLYLNGGAVGSTFAPINSGVVVGGCSSSINGAGATPCTNGGWNFHVKANDTFVPQDAPAETLTDIQHDYSTFDPGPAHHCAAGNNPYPRLADSVFDNNTTYDVGGSAGTFTLTPFSSYTCNSQTVGGASVGQLQWDNTTRKLTINGSVFIDGNLIINQSLTYTGDGVIEVSGTIVFSGNNMQVCAVTSCNLTDWQGTSGNNQMLTLVSLASNTNAITFQSNAQWFQGSLWTQPSSSLTFVKNGDQLQGPVSIGKFDSTFNNATLEPLPVIKNMPVGAPVPPNTGVTLSRITYVG